MRGLLGDRFLRRFTGGLTHWRKHLDSTGQEQNPEAEVDADPEPEAVGSDVHTLEVDLEEADANDKSIEPKAE